MNITIHTDPALGASHATVHGDLGDTAARFYGEACGQDAQLYVAAFMAIAGLQIMADASAWRIDRDNAVITAKLWRNGKLFQCERMLPLNPTTAVMLEAIANTVQGVMNIIKDDTRIGG